MKEAIKELKRLRDRIEKGKIHYGVMTSWSRNGDEGYNRGLSDVIAALDKRIKTLEKQQEK